MKKKLLKTLLEFKGIYRLYIQNSPKKISSHLLHFQDSLTTTSSHLLHDLMCQMQQIGQFVSDLQISRWGRHQIQEACNLEQPQNKKKKKIRYRVEFPLRDGFLTQV